MELSFAPKSMQMSMLKLLPKPASFISSVWFATHGGRRQPLAYCLVHRSTLFSSRKFRGHNLKLARCVRFNDFSDGESSEWFGGDFQLFDYTEDEENHEEEPAPAVYEESGEEGKEMELSMQLLPSKVEFLEPYLLGIRPEPPYWPERDEVSRISIEHKANSLDIPLSLRIIKKKQRWKEGFVDAGEYAYCSVKNAFSSLVFIIRELQNHTWQIRENLQPEDLRVILTKMQGDLNSMFVWLFQQVFSKTPTLMVYLMLLLANFSVHSMAPQQPSTTQKAIAATMSLTEEESEETSGSGSSTSLQHTSGELDLWKSMVEEAARMQGGHHQKINMQFRPDNHEELVKRNIVYQMCIAEEPTNPLLVVNYARFLYLVAHDHDRAEEWFKRAIQIEPPDAEALGQYADFLWKVRNDHWEAEERYLQAVAADPENPHYASKYADFLWSTGAKDICFPLSSPHDSYNKVS
ncbi:hypothetical protein QQP08_005020 [Theobroma cacao]|uniref:Uncharacterized protein LOC18585917 n=1 Tax=Theobroma cacao TaxID=3641 RepID=A0AB32WY44_THECC|nr:PREDICTED: uncharacterized protein LOC18585917 [Theobroma cacao]WRX12533.1 hypothetical protein QQP08_005020 [Theobroma cacao]